MEKLFEPLKVNDYSADDLFELCETGIVTLKMLEDAGLNKPTLLELKERIQKFQEIKENDDWDSVKYSEMEEIEKYLDKYQHKKTYGSETSFRLHYLERELSAKNEILHIKQEWFVRFIESKKAFQDIVYRNRHNQFHIGSITKEFQELDRIIDALDFVIHLIDPSKMGMEYCRRQSYAYIEPEYRDRPSTESSNTPKQSYTPKRLFKSFNLNFFKKKKELCNSAVFAPVEIAKGDDMLVQVYIYKDEETEKVIVDARISDKDATQRSYTPLNFPIKVGDKITVRLDMHGLSVEGNGTKSVIWQNKFTKCSFFAYVPINYGKLKATGDVYLSVNGLELGQMSFFSTIGHTTDLYHSAQVENNIYEKVFISYSHKDDYIVKAIADAYKALGTVNYFYDRHTLSPGEFFEKEIYKFIDQSDLFILCWSKNAKESEWVTKERVRAYYRAIDNPPKIKIYPINIRPFAAPPSDLAKKIHFEDYDKLIDLSQNQDENEE